MSGTLLLRAAVRALGVCLAGPDLQEQSMPPGLHVYTHASTTVGAESSVVLVLGTPGQESAALNSAAL